MKQKEHIADHSVLFSVFSLLRYKKIRKAGLYCLGTALRDFFGLQYKQKLMPQAPVYQVDHPLDAAIPFRPELVDVYLDFVYFWIRAAAFLMNRFGKDAEEEVAAFIYSMGNLYSFAAEVYRKGFSTTKRPRYYKRLRFVIIHLFDPHLMCIPSLHVMVVCRTYTAFRTIAEKLNAKEELTPYIDELIAGAVSITESILYVKQHSINCIPAAFYALSVFDGVLFSPEEMKRFSEQLLLGAADIEAEQKKAIMNHMWTLYSQFMCEGRKTDHWEEVLLSFLKTKPLAAHKNLA